MAADEERRICYTVLLLASAAVNLYFVINPYLATHQWSKPTQQLSWSWSRRAAEEAEAVAAIDCSGHGRAYLDGAIDGNKETHSCECNACYGGPDCSVFSPDCPADAESGDPLFLEPFWMQHAAASAIVISGWHRLSYSFPDKTAMSEQLENNIRKLHVIARNANTKGKHIVFGVGSTQLLNAAVYALSVNLSSRSKVVAASPFYPNYKKQTQFLQNEHFEYAGDATNSSCSGMNIIEIVTSPNNPDGHMREAVCRGPSVRTIHDRAYYWPHYTPIPAQADEDVMIFTISKLTGHAGSRFGWAFVKDEDVYQTMMAYIDVADMGISRETQLRALKLIQASIELGNGTEIFNHAYKKMSNRWRALNNVMSLSQRFSIQDIPPSFCNFFEEVRGPSPAYAWVKCEREEERDCEAVLGAGNILSRSGRLFNVEERYTRLSLLKSDDDFNILLYHLNQLVAEETAHPKFKTI